MMIELAYSAVMTRLAEAYTDFPQSRATVFGRGSFIFKTKKQHENSVHCKIPFYRCINIANKLLLLYKDYYVNAESKYYNCLLKCYDVAIQMQYNHTLQKYQYMTLRRKHFHIQTKELISSICHIFNINLFYASLDKTKIKLSKKTLKV